MTYLMMISTHLRNLRQDEKGVTALEYALMATLIAGAIVGTVTTLGTTLSAQFTTIQGYL